MAKVTYDRVVHVIHPRATIAQAKAVMDSAYSAQQSIEWALHDALGNVYLVDAGQAYLASTSRRAIFHGYAPNEAATLVAHFQQIAPGGPITYEVRPLIGEAPPSSFAFAAYPAAGIEKVVTQAFGSNPPGYPSTGGHEGVDLRAPNGNMIVAVADGKVIIADSNPAGDYGRQINIDHGDGWQTLYAHLQEVRVAVNQQVKAHQLIGLANNTGNSSGAHLHLTLKRIGYSYTDANGKTWPYNIFDPTPYLAPRLSEPGREARIDYSASATKIKQGQTVQLRWDVDFVKAVYMNGVAAIGHEVRTLTPQSTTVYTLRCVCEDNAEVTRSITVEVEPTPPPSGTPATAAQILGVHELGENRKADAAAARCGMVMAFNDALGAYQLSKANPSLMIMHRIYFRVLLTPAQLLDQHGIGASGSDSRVWYRGINESDIDGFDSSPDGIRRRAAFDIECATLLRQRAPNARWVAGGFAHGNPDFNNADVCRAVQEAYAPHYNSGLILFDIHNYSKSNPSNPKDFRFYAPIWFERRWQFLFEKCGFNPSVRGIVSSEAGIESGRGGFRQGQFSPNEFADWCRYYLQVQQQPLVIGGVSYPSPFLGSTIFQWGNNSQASGGWWGYGLDEYIGTLSGFWSGQATTTTTTMDAVEIDLYAGEEPAYVEPPVKALEL